MKKSLLLSAICCLTLTLWAGDGSSKKSPIEFDWENGNMQEATSKAIWYRVNLDKLYTEANPALALYIINETDSTIHVQADATLLSQQESREYDIAPYQNKIWSVPVDLLVRMKATECFLTMTTNGKIRISANVQDVRDIDKACINAQQLEWNTPIDQNSGSKWYVISLRDAKDAVNDGKSVKLTLINKGASPATVKFLDSPDCPSTGTTEHVFNLDGNKTQTVSVPRTALDMLEQTETYLQLTTDAAIQFTVEMETSSSSQQTASMSTSINLYEEFNIVEGNWYKIPLSDIHRSKYMPEIKVTNESGSPVTLDEEIMYTKQGETSGEVFTRKDITVAANATNIATIEPNIISALVKAGYTDMYIRATNPTPLKGYIRMRHIHEGEDCSTPRNLSDGVAEHLDKETLVWFALPIDKLKSTTPYNDLLLTVNSQASATLSLQVATACPAFDTQDYTYSVNGGEEFNHRFPSSFFRMLLTDTLFIGMEASQALNFTAKVVAAASPSVADVCSSAIDFNWDYGHQLAADSAQWYKIPLGTLHLNGKTADLLPVLSITNRGSEAANVTMKMSQECPLQSEPVAREISIAAGETYESAISMDMLTGINPLLQELYAYISSSQDIDWRIRFVRENEGSSCAVPYLFNWVSGNDIDNTTAWYMVDLREAKTGKEGKYDILFTVKNLDDAASLTLGLAPTCPCDALQSQKANFSAGQTRQHRLAHSSFASLPDTVWVRAAATGRFHAKAELIEADPFVPVEIKDPQPIQWGVKIEQTEDSVWYYILPDILNEVTDRTARLKIENGSSYNVVYTYQTYNRQITSQLSDIHLPVGPSDTVYRVFERAMADLMTKYDTVFVCLAAKKPFSFTMELADPNTGDNCEHALTIVPGDRWEHPVETDVWYKVNVREIADTIDSRVDLFLKNMDNKNGRIYVDLHTNCDSAAFQSFSYSLTANSTIDKEFDSDFIKGLNMDVFYAHVTSETRDSIITTVIPEVKLQDTIFVCDSAIACVPNTDYYQHAGDTVWYLVNVKNIRENTVGDAVLRINNADPTVQNHFVGELAWNCPVVKKMTYKSYDITKSYTRKIERATINSHRQDVAYLRIVATHDFTFRVDVQLAKGDECKNAILFDWHNGNIHPKDSIFWYQVVMDSTMFEDTSNPDSIVYRDMRLLVENLADDSTSAGADIFFDCDDPSLGSFSYTFAPSGSKYKDIDRDLLVALGWPDMYLSYHSSNATRISASFISEAEKVYYYDTIQATVCDSSKFIYQLNEDKSIVREVYSGDPASQWFTDTVSFVDGTSWNDSVYVFHVKPIVMLPILNTAEALDTIAHALPILKQGMVPFFDSSLVALRNYYKFIMTDTLSAIVDEDDIYWYNEYYAPLSKKMTTFNAYYAFQDSCFNWYNFNLSHDYEPTAEKITFMVEPWRYDTLLASTDTVCPGKTVTIRGKNYVVNSEVYIRDTVANVTVKDTLNLDRLIDSVYVYHYYTWVYPDLETELPAQPVVACGKSIDCSAVTAALRSLYDEKDDPLDVTITDVIWQRKNLTTSEFEALPTPAVENRLDSATQSVELRYGLITECDDTIFSETIPFTPDPYVRVYKSVADTVCAGTDYEGAKTSHIVTSPFVTWNDTVLVETDTLTFDSVYIYAIHAYAMPEPVTTLSAQPVVACGKAIDCSAATAALRSTYIDEKSNPLDVTVTEVIWQRKDVGADTYAALDSTRVDRAVTSVTLRYGLVTECDTVYSVDFEFTPTAYVVVEQVVKDTVCAGTEYQGVKTTRTISAYTEWNDIVPVETDTLTFDSVYVYQITPYDALTLPTYTTPLYAEVGSAVDVTTQTAELKSDFAQTNNQPLVSIAWEIQLPQTSSWTDLTAAPLDVALAGLTAHLRYTVTTSCESDTSDVIDLPIHGYYRVDTTIIDTVCVGTEYAGRLTAHTVSAFTEWQDSVHTDGLVACDSVFHYRIYSYFFALPEDLDLFAAVAICDTAVSVEAPQAQIDELMADPLFAPNTVVTWQMFRGSQWNTLTADPIYDDEVRIRVNITSDCGTLTSDEATLLVHKPTADNQTQYSSLPAEAMFGNRIVMINYRASREELGLDSISPDSVRWYRVVGEPDKIECTMCDDEFLATGYYYTTGEPLVGRFYARLMYHESQSMPCGAVARTRVVDCILQTSAPQLSPTIVRPRQTMNLSGIMPDAKVTVSVFSQLGELIERYSGTGATLTQIQAAASLGCYLVHIAYDDESTTFKYIVK